ncbi:MAG: hypothetical protein A2285_05950 [Elusimicrobia bacterium RIFOXYA12_FULL_57_11]|nr:MAG: hypothetical protein A2285_05950 [Elusimicrobia bacterium RIFOXYA12_FULL_57_11]
MIAAVTATAVFSVVLSSHVGGTRSDKKEAASMALKAAQEQLKIYVSAVPSDPMFSPNGGVLPGDLPAGVWALSAGTHDVSFMLNDMPQLAGTPPPTLTYTVVNVACEFGSSNETSCKKVTFTITYPN